MMNLKKPGAHVLRSSWIVGAMILVSIVSLDWSSMCHPSPEGEAMKDKMRIVASSQPSYETPNKVATESALGFEELTWEDLTDVEFKDVYVEETHIWAKCRKSRGKEIPYHWICHPRRYRRRLLCLKSLPICELFLLWRCRTRNGGRPSVHWPFP